MRQLPRVRFKTMVSVVLRSTGLPLYSPMVRPCDITTASEPVTSLLRLVISSLVAAL